MSNACNFTDIFNGTRPHNVPVIRDTSLALAIIGLLYIILSFSRLVYFKNRYDHLRKRSLLYAGLNTLATLLQIISGTLFIAVDFDCWFAVALSILVTPLVAIAVPLRMLDHFAKYVYARGILGLDIDKDYEIATNVEKDTWFDAMIDTTKFTIMLILKGHKLDGKQMQVQVAATTSDGDVQPIKKSTISMKSILLLKFLISTHARVLVSMICLLPFIIIIIVDFQKYEHLYPSNHCKGCTVNANQSVLILVAGGIIISLSIIVAIIVRRYPDPFGIMTECRMSMMYGGLTAVIGLYLTTLYPNGINDEFSFPYLILIGLLIIQFICTDYQIIIARRNQTKLSKWVKKHNTRLNGSIAITDGTDGDASKFKNLRDILSSPDVVKFEDYLVGEYSVELIRMYQDCRYYEEKFFDMNENTKRAKVKRIVSLYVTLNAPLEVNLPYAIKESIIKAVSSNEPLPQNLFKDSQNEILMMLFGPWRRYLAYQERDKNQSALTNS